MEINFYKDYFSKFKISKIELIGFLAGVKPAILAGFYNDNDIDVIKSIFAKFRLKKRPYFINDLRERQQWLAISSDLKIAKELMRSFLRKDFEKVGRLLGYPSCCAKRYVDDLPDQATACDISARTMGLSSWYINNVFNPQTRPVISDKEKDMPKLREIGNINAKTKTYPLYLISHFPCSYNCEKSIKIGRKIFEAIKKFDPADAQLTEETLKKPILFFDSYHYIVFNGMVKKNNAIIYSSISLPKSLIPANLFKKIEEGNKISIEEKRVVIFKRNKVKHCFKFNNITPVILNFI
ncbi:MAG: DUF483 domain-containing protein [Candidatus Pacebacteria bacterium]|nr:DUF483 domain-containing protein [Candidatus Paceibacterota bacterium]